MAWISEAQKHYEEYVDYYTSLLEDYVDDHILELAPAYGQLQEAVDGTYTIETYKQSSEVTETGTIPSVTTEGRIYSAVMSVEESDAVTSTRYVQAGEMETGDKRL